MMLFPNKINILGCEFNRDSSQKVNDYDDYDNYVYYTNDIWIEYIITSNNSVCCEIQTLCFNCSEEFKNIYNITSILDETVKLFLRQFNGIPHQMLDSIVKIRKVDLLK